MDLERLPLHVEQTTHKEKHSLLLPEIEETFHNPILSDFSPASPSNMDIGMSIECPSEEEEEEEEENGVKEEKEEKMDGVKEEKDAMEVPKKGKRRRRAQPVKFSDEFSPQNPKKPKLRKCRDGVSASPKVPAAKRLKRGSRCGTCSGCLRDDCGTCSFCLDKPKFGGPGKKKQRCALRTCSNFEHKSSAFLKREERLREKDREERVRKRKLYYYAERQDRNGREEEVVDNAVEESEDADSAEMDAPGTSTPSTSTPSSMLTPTHMTIAHDSAQVTIADDAGHVTMLTGPPISVHDLAVMKMAEAKKAACDSNQMSDDITTTSTTTSTPPTLVHDVATDKLASAKKTLASNQVSILDIKNMAERMVQTQQLIQSTLMEQTAHSSRSGASAGKMMGISTSKLATSLPLKAAETSSSKPTGLPLLNGSSSRGQAEDSFSKEENNSKSLASKPADKVKGSAADKAKGSAADKVKGSAADKAKGSAADKVKGSAADKAKGSAADKVKGSASKPADKVKGSASKPADKVKGSEVKPVGKVKGSASKPADKVKGSASKPADKVKGSEVKPADKVKGSEVKLVDKVKGSASKPADNIKSSEVKPADKGTDSPKGISKAPAISTSKKNISLNLGAKVITSPVSTVVVTPYVSPSTTPPKPKSATLTQDIIPSQTSRSFPAGPQSANMAKQTSNLRKILESLNKKKAASNHMEAPTKEDSAAKGTKTDTGSSRLEVALKAPKLEVKKTTKTVDSDNAPSPRPKGKKIVDPDIMMCIQCGRERSMRLARSNKFCTQRCIIEWMENNPGKTPRDAPVLTKDEIKASSSSSSSSSSSAGGPPPLIKTTPTSLKPHDSPKSSVPRALKNLQIDMAKPGTKLSAAAGMESPSDEDSGSEELNTAKRSGEVENPNLASIDPSVRPSLINSLATMISQQQKTSDPMPTAEAAERSDADKASGPVLSQGVKVPLKGAVKRSVVLPGQATAVAKRQKMSAKTSAQGSHKSVSFNLKPSEAVEASSIASSIPSSLEKIASYLQPKKPAVEVAKIKLPPGLPSDIRQWSVSQVVEYFKSTSDCKGYVDLFETQEVDGIALLLLTHETLVKCLGIKLGRTVKIMSRVQELKVYYDHHHSTNSK